MFSQFFQLFPFYKQNYFFSRHMKIHMQSVKIRPEISSQTWSHLNGINDIINAKMKRRKKPKGNLNTLNNIQISECSVPQLLI